MSEPHLLRVHVSSRLVAGLLCFGKRPTCELVVGLPEDARLYRCSYDFCTDCFVLVFEHPTFPKCEHGAMIQEFFPMVRDVPKAEEPRTYGLGQTLPDGRIVSLFMEDKTPVPMSGMETRTDPEISFNPNGPFRDGTKPPGLPLVDGDGKAEMVRAEQRRKFIEGYELSDSYFTLPNDAVEFDEPAIMESGS